MRKVLVIANLHLPSPRISSITKYLPEFGWEAVILDIPTVMDMGQRTEGKLRDNKIYELIKPLLRPIYRIYSEFSNYPDAERIFKSSMIEEGSRILDSEKIDVILSSSSPVTCHTVARELKRKYSRPWIADMRDAWTQNHNYSYSRMRRMFERRLEVRTLRDADAIVVVSESWIKRIKKLHTEVEVYSIPNGFNVLNQGNKLTERFTITYTGQIYWTKQNVTNVLRAVKDLDYGDIELRFYGPVDTFLNRAIKNYTFAKYYGVIPREEAWQRQAESQVLLLLNWEDPKEKDILTLKIFEYMGARRPILATGGYGKDAVERLLNETKAGVYCQTVDEIIQAVMTMYQSYKSTGTVTYNGDINEIVKHHFRERTRELAILFDNVEQRSR